MKVVYKGKNCFNIILEEPDSIITFPASSVEDAKKYYLQIMGESFDNAVCAGLMEKDGLSTDVMDWPGVPLKFDNDAKINVNDLNREYGMPHVDIMRGLNGINC